MSDEIKECHWICNREHRVDILLSTYNGAKYLPELLESILMQTYQGWRLLIRDDGSTDGTTGIVNDFCKQYSEKVLYLQDEENTLGPSQSFSRLMNSSDAKYILFCDQDDVWLNNKVELTLEKMLQLENEAPNQPLLLHTDLMVVNEKLHLLSNSFLKYQKLNPELSELHQILIQNVVTGCTLMINRPLKLRAHPIPNQAIMHDWWLALTASIFGRIYYINCPTILYRQHGRNSVGAKKYGIKLFMTKFRNASESIKRTLAQGKCLSKRFGGKLNEGQIKCIENYIYLPQKSRVARMRLLYKYGFKKHGFLRNLGFIITILLWKRSK
ncbi:glycosyltransferase family 2 protein [Marinicrinis sediminis]|uniref:Glycosyltransferase family 2 protein n=1 Tax=Marinicrinis sediminis TaxID=1652465 RepID=A0ABW5RB50_9BACL